MIRGTNIMSTSRLRAILAASVAWVCFMPVTASAQDARNADGASDGEIIVTGERALFDAIGSQTLVNTPFSVSAVSSAVIEDNAIDTLNEITKLLPSSKIASPSTTTGSLITIRGESADLNLVDGQPVFSRQIDIPLEPYEQVQVLAGVSSFYFGASSGGGIVNYITKRPTSQLKAVASVGFDSESVFSTTVDVGDTVGRFGYRFNLATTNGTQSTRKTEIDRYVGSFALDYRIGDNTTLSLDGLYSDKSQSHVGGYLVYDGEPFLRPVSGRKELAGPNSKYANILKGGTATLRHDLTDKINFKLAGSLYQTQYKYGSLSTNVDNLDGDVSQSVYFFANYIIRTAVISGTVNAEFDTGPLNHALSTGFLFTNDKTYYGATSDGTQFPYGLIDQNTNIYNNYIVPDVPTGIEQPSLRNKTLGDRSRQGSGFISDNISIGESVKVLVGVRYFDFNNRTFGGDFVTGNDIVDRAKKFVPLGAVIFKPTASSTIYTSYSQGITNGGTIINPDPAGDFIATRFPLIKTDQYEVGFKYETSRLKAQFAIYQTDTQNNFYVTDDSLGLPQGAITRVVPGAGTRRRGAEASGQVLLGDRITLFGGISYTDITNNNVTPDIAPRNQRGEWLYKARLSARADADGDLEGFIGLDGNSKSLALYNRLQTIPAYNLVDVGVSYKFDLMDRNVRLNVVVNNVLGEKYWVTDFDSAFPGDARTLKTQLSVEL